MEVVTRSHPARPAPVQTSTGIRRRRVDGVYREHARFVWRVVRRLGVEPALAEDLVHEVFLIVHRRIADFDGRASMTAWLYGIARGVAANHRRGRSREQRRIEHTALQTGPAHEADEQVRTQQAAGLLARFLAELDPDKRVAFELAEFEGLRAPEIADLLGVNVDTIYSRLREARRRFVELIAQMQEAD